VVDAAGAADPSLSTPGAGPVPARDGTTKNQQNTLRQDLFCGAAALACASNRYAATGKRATRRRDMPAAVSPSFPDRDVASRAGLGIFNLLNNGPTRIGHVRKPTLYSPNYLRDSTNQRAKLIEFKSVSFLSKWPAEERERRLLRTQMRILYKGTKQRRRREKILSFPRSLRCLGFLSPLAQLRSPGRARRRSEPRPRVGGRGPAESARVVTRSPMTRRLDDRRPDPLALIGRAAGRKRRRLAVSPSPTHAAGAPSGPRETALRGGLRARRIRSSTTAAARRADLQDQRRRLHWEPILRRTLVSSDRALAVTPADPNVVLARYR